MTGFAAYRATVDTEKIKSDPDTAWLLDNPGLNLWYEYNILGINSFHDISATNSS